MIWGKLCLQCLCWSWAVQNSRSSKCFVQTERNPIFHFQSVWCWESHCKMHPVTLCTNIRDKMIRKKCQKEWKTTSDLWRPNNGHLCGPWQNNLLQSIIIVFNSFFTSPVYIRQKCVKDSETCFCRRTRYALILLSCLLVSGRHQAE